tara:strand:- start:13109 stop:14125 length:1017 start_codon:yes stop_codon:yes gene_type:complete
LFVWGDVTQWRDWNIDWASIDLFIGGSPCQGFSAAGKQGGTKAELNGEITVVSDRETYLEMKELGAKFLSHSYLFWEYVLLLDHIKQHNPNVKFMLENVKMSQSNTDMITNTLEVEPVVINSALVGAQNRVRYYWANWEFGQPENENVFIKDIIEEEVDSKYYLTEEQVSKIDLSKLGEYIKKDIKILGHRIGYRRNLQVYDVEGKTETLDTCTGGGRHPHMLVKCVAQGGRNIVDGKRVDYKGAPTVQRLEPRTDGKTNCLTTVQKDNYVFEFDGETYAIRRFTPLECERLMTLSDYYCHVFDENGKQLVSNSQMYKALGNGWSRKVITHIFKHLDF